MECQIGCKANGLGTCILLKDGVPRSETMNALLKSIDEQLLDTNRQIEACVKSVLEMSNGMLSSEVQNCYHPGEALKNIGQRQLLEKTSCYDPNTEVITKLLNHVIETLNNHPGSEEIVLQQMLQLNSQEGLSLPIQSSISGSIEHSVMSINTAVHDSESNNEALWTTICMRLRRFFTEKLQNLPTSLVPSEIDLINVKRLGYINSLCFLYSPKEVYGKYRSIRSQQFGAQLLTYGLSNLSTTENIKFIKGVQHFEKLVLLTKAMMQEDFSILNSGIFGNVINTIEALYDIYLDKILDEVGAITESLQNELSVVVVKPVGKTSKDTNSKAFPKSTSDVGSLNQFRGGLRKQQSKSLDTLLSQEDNFTDLQSLPADITGVVVRFVNCVLNIDAYIQHLQALMTWEISSSASKTQQKRLKSALKAKRDPDMRLHSKNRPLYVTGDSDLESSVTFAASAIPPGVASQAMMAEMTASLRVVEKQASEKKQWDWQSFFTKVSTDLAKCVEQKIGAVYEKIVEIDRYSLDKMKCFEMTAVNETLIGGRLDFPAKLSTGIGLLFEELDLLLVLAKAFSDGPVYIIRSAFVDCVSTTFKNIHIEITKISSEVNTRFSVHVWYQCLANVTYIRNQLLYYENMLSVDDHRNAKKLLNSHYKQYCELAEQLKEQVIDYHCSVLSTSILHDAESHNWEDSKDFYEGERCSFDIQMWHLHMKGLQHDLWSCCSPMVAQNIYITVLNEAMKLYEQRYSKVKPSYRRTKQVRYDITAILLYTFELLMPGCKHLGTFLDPNTNQQLVYSVHNSCCTLLSVLAVVTSPLDMFYKVFKKGYKKRHSRSGEAQIKMYISHWLSWILPEIFLPGKDNLEDLQTTTALYLQLKLLVSQPGYNFGLFLESLLMKDFTLSILLLTQTAKHYNTGKEFEETSTPGAVESSDKVENNELALFSDFFDIFAILHEVPEALSKVLLPVFERTDTWHLLDNTTSLGRSHPIPPWIQVILNSVQKYVKRAIEPGIKVLLQKVEDELVDEIEPVSSIIHELPCGCSYTNIKSEDTPRKAFGKDDLLGFSVKEENIRPQEHKEVMAEAIYSVITQMNYDLYMLPTPLIMFFKALQDQISQKGLHSSHDCVAIKVLATSLRTCLIDTEMVEGLLGLSLSEEMKDNLRMLAECTYHVLTATSYGKSSGIPRVASVFIKANRNWLSEQIELLSDHFCDETFELPETLGPLHGVTSEFSEQLMLSLLTHIQSMEKGLEKLTDCYNFVKNNFDWINEQLDVPPMLGNQSVIKGKTFTLSSAKKEEENFNPILEYSHVGVTKFDQAYITEFDYNWSSLLQSDLGLSEVGMKNLLLHRHEMQEDAYLEESEKKPVEVLKKKFDYVFTDLV